MIIACFKNHPNDIMKCIYIYMYIHIYVCVCVCVCVFFICFIILISVYQTSVLYFFYFFYKEANIAAKCKKKNKNNTRSFNLSVLDGHLSEAVVFHTSYQSMNRNVNHTYVSFRHDCHRKWERQKIGENRGKLWQVVNSEWVETPMTNFSPPIIPIAAEHRYHSSCLRLY